MVLLLMHLPHWTGREGINAAYRSMMAPWAIERADRARRRRGWGDRRGGRRTMRGGGDAVVDWVAAVVNDNGEDDDGIRWHQATTNPVMARWWRWWTMTALVDNDDNDETAR